MKTLEIEDGRVELRAITGPDYGRIFDHELVYAVQASLATAQATRAGKCRAGSTGRRASTTRASTSPGIRLRSTPPTSTTSRSSSTTSIRSRSIGCRTAPGRLFPRLLTAGTPRSAPRRWGWRAPTSGGSARTATSGSQAVDLDMAAAGWTPTVDNLLGHISFLIPKFV